MQLSQIATDNVCCTAENLGQIATDNRCCTEENLLKLVPCAEKKNAHIGNDYYLLCICICE